MGKRLALYILIGLAIIGVILIYFISVEEEPEVFSLIPPWEGEIKEVFWIDNENIIITLFSREGEGETESRIYKSNPFSGEEREIFRTKGWRLELSVLDFTREKDLIAIKEGDRIKLIDFSGNTVFMVEEAGTNTQALFSPDLGNMAFTTFAEWELPTNAYILDLNTWEKEQVTDYEFGQNFKTGRIGWDQEGGFYFVEEFAFGTLTIGGQRLFYVKPDGERELYWEVPGAEQIIGFNFLESQKLLAFFVEWDDEAMDTQLFFGCFDVEKDKKDWVMPLDRMGDRELWKQKNTGYPGQGEILNGHIFVTRINEKGLFTMLEVDLETGEIIKEIEKTGFPHISPDNERIIFLEFSGEEPLLKVAPLTNLGDLR